MFVPFHSCFLPSRFPKFRLFVSTLLSSFPCLPCLHFCHTCLQNRNAFGGFLALEVHTFAPQKAKTKLGKGANSHCLQSAFFGGLEPRNYLETQLCRDPIPCGFPGQVLDLGRFI